jgi:pimeloyl-ACP methyl ester carboxylesterase
VARRALEGVDECLIAAISKMPNILRRSRSKGRQKTAGIVRVTATVHLETVWFYLEHRRLNLLGVGTGCPHVEQTGVMTMSRGTTLICATIFATASFAVTAVAADTKPVTNIVLVHGAWVDGSGWKPVYDILTKDGFKVSVVQEPLTSLANDAAATKRILDLQDGPAILVGHSYGGSVITEAGVHPKVVGLVYVAAHAPEVGEDESALGKKTPSVLGKTTGAIKTTPDGFTYLDPAEFPKLFAPDLPHTEAHFAAHSQILTAGEVFGTPLTAAAWKTKPSWGIVAGDDQIINPDLERWYYARAKSHTTVVPGASHSVYESHPKEVAAVIEQAAHHALAAGVPDVRAQD